MTLGFGPFWSRNGAMFVEADSTTLGPTEYLPAMRARGYGWVAFNVATGEWPDERRIATELSLDPVPWMRVRTLTDLDTLRNAQRRWDSHAIVVNLEIEDTRQPDLMAKSLLRMSEAGKALVITDAWADPLGCWHGFGHWVGSVECFPEADPAFSDVTGCCLHAGAFFRAVVPCLGAYGTTWRGRLPVLSDYIRYPGPHIVYPGDNVERWDLW